MLGPTERVHLCTPGARHEAIVSLRRADSVSAVLAAFAEASETGQPLTLVGGRRSFGGQGFPTGGALGLDVGALERGATALETEADGSLWIRAGGGTRFCDVHQSFPGYRAHGGPTTDSVTLAGSLSACVHNIMGYFADEVRAFTLLTPAGERIACRRDAKGRSGELFEACVGAFGCLGVVTDIELRLRPVERDSAEVVIESRYAGSAKGCAYLAALEVATDDPQHDAGAGALMFGCEGHAIVLGQRFVPDGQLIADQRAPLTDDDHERNALTQGLSNRFPRLAGLAISRAYPKGRACWADWYGSSYYQRSYDRAASILRGRGPHLALARAVGVDPRLPVYHQSWFFPRDRLREVMALYWAVLRRYPGVESRAETQDLVLLPPSRWPLHTSGAGPEALGVLTSSFAVRPETKNAARVSAFLARFSRLVWERVPSCRVSLCKQIHCDTDMLRAMHASWIETIRGWRAQTDPEGLLRSRFMAKLGL